MHKNLLAILLAAVGVAPYLSGALEVSFDQLSANGLIRYRVPENASERVQIKLEYQLAGADGYRMMCANPLRSKTAMTILTHTDPGILEREQQQGFEEFLSAGRQRTAVWQTANQLPMNKIVSGKVRLTVTDNDQVIKSAEKTFTADFTGVILLNKFAGNPDIFPAIVAAEKRTNAGWYQEPGRYLEVREKEDLLEPLSYRHRLKGAYAIYVSVPVTGCSEMALELTGDGFARRFSGWDGYEYFWKAARMDNTHLVLRQMWRTLININDHARARLNYIKFVPLTDEQYQKLNGLPAARRDKLLIGYFEPYSWAFRELVNNESDFMQPLLAYQNAHFDWVDSQVGRGGSTPLYASSIDEPLLGATQGDAPHGSSVRPVSLGTGRMVRIANPVRGVNRAGKALDLTISISFGAANNYRGGPLESAYSKAHPERFIDKYYLNYADSEARKYFLNYYREVLQMGAKNVSLDFCRYPHGVRKAADATEFLRELRKLADEFSTAQEPVKILVRFPVPGNKGVLMNKGKFDAASWVKEGLVDILVPSDFGGMPFFDIKNYVEMVKGTKVKLVPCIDALSSGRPFPGNVLLRADSLYSKGADGVYFYQADSHVVGSMTGRLDDDTETFRLLGSSAAVKQAVAAENAKSGDYSTNVYISYPSPYNSSRLLFWIEGCNPEKVDMYIENKLITSRTAPPWMLGEMGYANHYEFLGKNKQGHLIIHLPGNKKWRYDFTLPQVLRAVSF